MITETRGRKKLPNNQKKMPITLFFTNENIDMLGGYKSVKNILYNYSSLKIKQHEKKTICNT